MKRTVGLWKWGEILPKKDSSWLRSFAAIVVSYMPSPLLFVLALRIIAKIIQER
jgi:hypothetical protein